MPTGFYKCSICGGTFDLVRNETWSEEKAIAEYKKLFPNSKWEDRRVVCDDCWEQIKPSKPVYE